MSDERLGEKKLFEEQHGQDMARVLPTEDEPGNNELHRGLKNRHAQMISCVIYF